MFLKSIKIYNFRKFGVKNNQVKFVDAENYVVSRTGADVNIASTTTLIVGKNNAGKTTIITALDKLIHGEKIKANDINYTYLRYLISRYQSDIYEEMPYIEFVITIGLDKGKEDYITNIVPFMILSDVDATELDIVVKYELADNELFIKDVKGILEKKYDEVITFSKILEVIDDSEFELNYYNRNDILVEKFHLNTLIELAKIEAITVTGEKCLSEAFNKIVQYRYKELSTEKEKLEDNIIKINESLTKDIDKKHTKDINASLKRIIADETLQVALSADLSFQKLFSSLIKYEYVEKDNHIPENQFGLGYTNLMMIIAKLIEYMEKYPESSFNSKINLISIEEPETYMHPQMQELFIRYINDAVNVLLGKKHKNVNSQLLITTHSSHILNSKIHEGGSFDNINYITVGKDRVKVLALNDEMVAPDGQTADKDFMFVKKHIKFGISDLFFADAAILVEGISEYNILPYYLDTDGVLKHYYISVMNINGAHGLVYSKLIKMLGIPTVIITDLDIKRSESEKDKYAQITNLNGKITTNKTIQAYNSGNAQLDLLPFPCIRTDNVYLTYQNKISYYYPTSFEEAFILTNYKNGILNEALKEVKPDVYKKITDDGMNLNKNRKFSYMWQRKLKDEKSDFSNELWYRLLTSDDKKPQLPNYILGAFDYLRKELKSG